jgi:hypothetical protein
MMVGADHGAVDHLDRLWCGPTIGQGLQQKILGVGTTSLIVTTPWFVASLRAIADGRLIRSEMDFLRHLTVPPAPFNVLA